MGEGKFLANFSIYLKEIALFFKGSGLCFIVKWFDLKSVIDFTFLKQRKTVRSLGNERINLNVSFNSFEAWMIFEDHRLTKKYSGWP